VEKIILYQNKKILYRKSGSGDPVMFVHGFGEDGTVWNDQVEFLKNKYQIITPDLPGSGRSEMINEMSMEGIAEVLHSIIHEENISTCTVIGHSMGGYITLALVENYWNHVNAFGLFHSSAFADSEEKKETRKKGIDFIKQHGAFEFLKTATPNLFSPHSKEQMPNSIDEFIESLKSFSADALIAYYEAMMKRPDRTPVLKNTKNSVLFIAGEHDNAIPLEDVLKQCHLPEKSYFHLLKKSGHMGMMEETEKANRILEEFLANE
jgi:pimeloyl-ACP methyl ester carboxylesterase